MAPRWIMLLLAAVLLGLTQRAEASSAEVAATASPGPKKSIGRCKNCVYVLERIKQGYHYLLPNICEEIMAKTGDNDEYATVGNVVRAPELSKIESRGPPSHLLGSRPPFMLAPSLSLSSLRFYGAVPLADERPFQLGRTG